MGPHLLPGHWVMTWKNLETGQKVPKMEVFKLQFRGFSLPRAEIVIQSRPKYGEAMVQIWSIGLTSLGANQVLKSRKNVT